jgi:hypothetical protein
VGTFIASHEWYKIKPATGRQPNWGNNMFKQFSARLAALLALAVVAGAVHATPTGFNGDYGYSTWTSSQTAGAPTHSSIANSGQTLMMYEPDAAPNVPQEFRFSHAVAADGMVSFDWLFDASVDACCSGLNFYVNGALTNLAGGYFGNAYHWNGAIVSGSFSTSLHAGDTIAFGAFSADGCCGASASTITAFDAPAAGDVPEPATVALFGLGLLGVAGLRLRRR